MIKQHDIDALVEKARHARASSKPHVDPAHLTLVESDAERQPPTPYGEDDREGRIPEHNTLDAKVLHWEADAEREGARWVYEPRRGKLPAELMVHVTDADSFRSVCAELAERDLVERPRVMLIPFALLGEQWQGYSPISWGNEYGVRVVVEDGREPSIVELYELIA